MAAAGIALRAAVSNAGPVTAAATAAAVDRCGPSGRRAPTCCSSSSVSLPWVSPIVQSARRWSRRRPERRVEVACMSVDVDDSASADSAPAEVSAASTAEEDELLKEDELVKEATEELQKELDPRRGLEETFLVVNAGKFECRSCGYQYDSAKGDSLYPVAAGTPFSELPEDWRCPTCGAAQSFFQSKGLEVAGFVQNQGYGFGGNSLTEGQKSQLIYGALLFFFVLFLLGYLLQ